MYNGKSLNGGTRYNNELAKKKGSTQAKIQKSNTKIITIMIFVIIKQPNFCVFIYTRVPNILFTPEGSLNWHNDGSWSHTLTVPANGSQGHQTMARLLISTCKLEQFMMSSSDAQGCS